MALPEPECGLVVSCSYLWSNEQRAGKIEGLKTGRARLCWSSKTTATARKSPWPRSPTRRPPKVKQHLGLDSERSWIILDDFNEFVWPGYDLRPIPGKAGRYDYGFLPPALFKQMVGKIIELRQNGLAVTPRD